VTVTKSWYLFRSCRPIAITLFPITVTVCFCSTLVTYCITTNRITITPDLIQPGFTLQLRRPQYVRPPDMTLRRSMLHQLREDQKRIMPGLIRHLYWLYHVSLCSCCLFYFKMYFCSNLASDRIIVYTFKQTCMVMGTTMSGHHL